MSPRENRRARRTSASAGGARNAYELVVQERPTWREAVIGSTFLLSVATVGACAAAAALAIRRLRRDKAYEPGGTARHRVG